MGEYDNYPMGVNGSDRYFNQPDPPECQECYAQVELDWTFCPYCGERIDWDRAEGGE